MVELRNAERLFEEMGRVLRPFNAIRTNDIEMWRSYGYGRIQGDIIAFNGIWDIEPAKKYLGVSERIGGW